MKHSLWMLVIVGGLAISACQRQAGPSAAGAPEAAKSSQADSPTTPAAPVAVASAPIADTNARADAPFDTKAFAGTFTGTLPCTDCPGTNARLVLEPDGRFTLEETRPGGSASTRIEGTWTVEFDDTQVRLDPDAKSEPDRQFAIASNDRLAPVDAQGQGAPQHDALGLSRSARK